MESNFIEVASLASARIDRAGGIIRGVKILGSVSRNNRRYTTGAMRNALPLYEGARVNVDHAIGKEGPRSYADRLGRLTGVRMRDESLYGDLQFNPRHPVAEQLIWDAEQGTPNVGLSHNVHTRYRREGGVEVVEEIVKVNSVDLVCDPASTGGLFESFDVDALEELTLVEELTGQRAPEKIRGIVESLRDGRAPTAAEARGIAAAYRATY